MSLLLADLDYINLILFTNVMKKIYLILVWVLSVNLSSAATVDTVEVFSKAMGKNIKTVTILPDNYDAETALPVLYLLHGYGGDYKNWVNRVPEIKDLADRYSMIIVCPDGGHGSWYWDSEVDESFQYETFVAKELVAWVDGEFKTHKERAARAITGLSMGGHGALYLAMKHQDVFGAGGSMSGGVDIRPFPKNWDMAKRLGSYAENPDRWEKHTVINQTHLLTPGSLELLIDCGTEDFFYQVNEALHDKLLARNIPHTYIVRPGTHNWDYWKDAIHYQVLFMHRYFQKGESNKQ